MSTNRILINLLNFVSPQIAGTGVFAKNLLKLWIPQIDPSISITILCSSSVDISTIFEIPRNKNVRIKAVRNKHFLSRILYEQCFLPFLLKRFDLYFSPTPALPFTCKLVSRKTKVVITIHDMIPFFVANKYGYLRSLYIKILSKYGARIADQTITVSENSKKDICSISGTRPEKVAVIYNFYISSVGRDTISYQNFFLSISTIEPGKNIEKTIEGFKKFLEQNPGEDYHFYWIGKVGWGYTTDQLNAIIESTGLSKKFVLLGYTDEQKKSELLSNCAALVYLSHYEGFGLGVLEALNYFKPAVVSNNSSLPEVIGNAGIICNEDDSGDIAEALGKIIKNSRTYIDEIPNQLVKFEAQGQIKKFVSVINRLI